MPYTLVFMKRCINFCPWTLPDLSRFLICILYLLGEATGGSVFFSKCFLWLGCLQMAVDGTGWTWPTIHGDAKPPLGKRCPSFSYDNVSVENESQIKMTYIFFLDKRCTVMASSSIEPMVGIVWCGLWLWRPWHCRGRVGRERKWGRRWHQLQIW